MSDSPQILIRRLAVKKVGIFSRRPSIEGWSSENNQNEALCRVSRDGRTAVEIKEAAEAFKDAKEGDAFFAVFNAPFPFSLKVDGGTDANNFKWMFDVSGFATIVRPEIFALAFRGMVKDDESYSLDMLEKHLGTLPSTIMHDKIIVDVLGVVALCDKDAQGHYVDMKYRLEQSKEVGEKVVSSAIKDAFVQLIDSDGAVEVNVTTFHAASADWEAAAAKDAEARTKEVLRKEAEEAAKAQEEADKAARQKSARENKMKRDDELAEEEHKLKLAEIRKRREAIEGPKPAITMNAQVLPQGRKYNTRDLFLETSSNEAQWQMLAGVSRTNSLTRGDRVRFELSANFDGWLHLYVYQMSGRVTQFIPGKYSSIPDGRIVANRTYVADYGGNLISIPLEEDGKITTAETGRKERFIAIITKYPVNLSVDSVKKMLDGRNAGSGCATRGGFQSVTEERPVEDCIPLEEAIASIIDLPPEDWVQGTLELEVV